MTDHLSNAILNALADGELSGDQLASTDQHLAECSSCTSKALYQSLLKSATAKAGQRYAPSPQLQERLASLTSQTNSQLQKSSGRTVSISPSQSTIRFGSLGWAAAAALLLASVSMIFVQRSAQRAERASAEKAALVTEAFDQHVATLADSQPLQVISTDRHTVKPWFQGKIPFSFNLPQGLPSDIALDGANLTYLGNQPVAQLLYSIGKHRVSVFLRQRSGKAEANEWLAERSGFHVMGFNTDDLEVVAVSDVDRARLSDLVGRIEKAQTNAPK
jgi:anti-sigma factor RsiW